MTEKRAFTAWPPLEVSEWEDTRDTVHLWTQIVGKVRMALGPEVNHWWGVTLYVDATGLTTSLMPYRDFGVEIAFDFVEHLLIVTTTRGDRRTIELKPRTVADFHAEFFSVLSDVGVEVSIVGTPVEVVEAIPFAEDTVHRSYDADAMSRFWMSLVSANRVFESYRGGFRGKSSPSHFFWGAFDLAVTRFSGRAAPQHEGGVPNCPDWVMHEAYSDEVASSGYWPGAASEGIFYAYAYPLPDGYAESAVLPDAAYYDHALGEFVLPYEAVRTAADPDAMLREFLDSTFEAARRSAEWP